MIYDAFYVNYQILFSQFIIYWELHVGDKNIDEFVNWTCMVSCMHGREIYILDDIVLESLCGHVHRLRMLEQPFRRAAQDISKQLPVLVPSAV